MMYLLSLLLSSWALSARSFQLPSRLLAHSTQVNARTLAPQMAVKDVRSDVGLSKNTNEKKKMQFGLGKIAFSLIPLSPEAIGRRKTILTEVVKDKVWTLDQLQGIINVNVPVRSTVIKLKDGLFVNNPVAPTEECVDYVKSIEKQTGLPVKYITLATLAVEHKGTVGAFARNFPAATVYTQPGQYAFPIDLPISFYFAPKTTLKKIPQTSAEAPWGDEIQHEILGPLRPPGLSGQGGFSETAFFHKETKTLMVTDTIVKVSDEPPAIIQDDPRAILYHARDDALEVVSDTAESRRRGWRRMVLFGLTFNPSGITVKPWGEAFKDLKQVTPEMRRLGEGAVPVNGGLYPWSWSQDDRPNFDALTGGPFVAPILQKLLLNREPEKVIDWAERVAAWPIERIVPCHLDNDIRATGADFLRAFDFLYEDEGVDDKSAAAATPKAPFDVGAVLAGLFEFGGGKKGGSAVAGRRRRRRPPGALEPDLALLNEASATLTKLGVLAKEAPKLKRR